MNKKHIMDRIVKFIIIILLISFLPLLSGCESKADREDAKVIVRNHVLEVDNSLLSDGLSLEEMKERYSDVEISNDEDRACMTVKGNFDDVFVQTKEEALIALSKFQKVLQIDSLTYSCKEESFVNDITIYDMVQMYQDVPVNQYGFKLFTDGETGKLLSIEGRYAKDISCSTEISSPDIVRDAVNKDYEILSYEKMICYDEYQSCINSYPMWFLEVERGDGYSTIIIDDTSISFLSEFDAMGAGETGNPIIDIIYTIKFVNADKTSKIFFFALATIVLVLIGIQIFKLKRSKKEQFSIGKCRSVFLGIIYILFWVISTNLEFPPAERYSIYIFLLLFAIVPFVFRIRGVYSLKSEIVLRSMEILINVMVILSVEMRFFSVFGTLLVLVYAILALVLDKSQKSRRKLVLVLFWIVWSILMLIFLYFLFFISCNK